MKSLLSHLLAVLAILGLMAAPAVAGRMTAQSKAAHVAMTTHVAMTDMASMAHAMPCCPHEKQKLPDCEKNCPFVALCAAQCVSAIPAQSHFLVRKMAQAEPIHPHNDVRRHQRSEAPPQRPPRI
jgi:hypothetical protein